MIRIVIIDDDIEMLTGLKEIINWEEYGYTVVGLADNGEKGLELIKKYKPEVVITDITMPAMDGLDLIENARQIVPDIKPVILTCHENFQYAKQAIKLRAYDYVLKYTLTKKNLIDIILNIKERIYQEREINAKKLRIDEEIKHNRDILKQKVFMDLISLSSIDKNVSDIREEAEAFNVKLPDNSYILAGIFIDNYEISIKNAKVNDNKLLSLAMENIFDEIYEDSSLYSYFPYSDDMKFILFWGDIKNSNSLNVLLNSKLWQYQKYINERLNIETSVCISKIYDNIPRLNESFNECLQLRNEYFYKGSLNIVNEKSKE